MKKSRKFLTAVLTLAMSATALFAFSACDDEQTELEKAYAQYVENITSAEGEPLSYEAWLLTIMAAIQGEKGETGAQGPQGEKGETGAQGPQGEKGDKGDKGDPGEDGKDGVDGSDGKDGQDGSDGKDGQDGSDGKDGQDGSDGKDGVDGSDGKDGVDGKSAYQIWLDNGNTGTEEDFLNWLKGLNDHNFGQWQAFSQGDVPCEQRMFFRICEDCNAIEWKNGSADDHDWTVVTTPPTCQAQGYDTKTCDICGKVETENYTAIADHAWATEYTYDNSYHWYTCATCGETKDNAEHTADETGACTVCSALVGPTAGVLYDLSADGTYAEVIDYVGTATRVRIADTYEGAPVTGIYNNAFKDKSITSIAIPDSVTAIGSYAFGWCYSLTSVYITDIAAWCNISFGGYEANPLSYAHKLYVNNELVTELALPDSVTTIGDYAFNGCDSLTSVEIPDSVISIGSSVFNGCDSLTSVVIPDSVTSIGRCAFYRCTSLTSVEIPDSVISIGELAFYDCTSLTFNEYGNCKYLGSESNPYYALIETISDSYGSYTIYEDTKIIADEAFSNCSRLSSIVIPDSVISIGSSAFYYCRSLTSVEIPDSVTTIGSEAFSWCGSLTSLIIGDSVTTIGYAAFEVCSSLTSVYYKGTAEEWEGSKVNDIYDLLDATKYYYVENEADVPASGNYWHYDENGNVAIW